MLNHDSIHFSLSIHLSDEDRPWKWGRKFTRRKNMGGYLGSMWLGPIYLDVEGWLTSDRVESAQEKHGA